MRYKVIGTYREPYSTKQYDTFDKIAYDLYGDSTVASYIINANPDKSNVVIFNAGESLYLPKLERVESSTLPKWKGGV